MSVFDRGFLFGDGVYEVVHAFGGRWLDMNLHVGRLRKSLVAVGIDPAMADELPRAARMLVGDTPLDASIYLQVTRGAGSDRTHLPQAGLVPTVFATLSQTESLAALRSTAAPPSIRAVTAPDSRWLRLEIKSISLMGALLPLMDAQRHGAGEVIFTRDGFVAEGGSSNIFAVIGGELVTPPLGGPPMLHGCLRTRLLSVAIANGIPVSVRSVPTAELKRATTILSTGSRSLIRVVASLDGEPVGVGAPGCAGGTSIVSTLWTGLLDAIEEDARRIGHSS
ncbi:MAG: aminotransferase class IV [Planctomycetota bacterium]|nr:aminotransferase class IV [Planctomycetota bacterium]MDA1106478.1 aminotransferase class IV [Planctomycetota bacterium]